MKQQSSAWGRPHAPALPRWGRKTLSLFLSVVLCLSMLPATALAETDTSNITWTADSASPKGYDNETFSNLFDGKKTEADGNKWCFGWPSDSKASVIFHASESVIITGYTFTTGGDTATETGRNPKSWTLYGSNSTTGTWTAIHTVTDDNTIPAQNYTDASFTVTGNNADYQYYKFEFTANQGDKSMQLAEITMHSKSACEHNWVADKSKPNTEATCTEAGHTYEKCTKCNAIRTLDIAEQPALGHDFGTDGKCTRCGIYRGVAVLTKANGDVTYYQNLADAIWAAAQTDGVGSTVKLFSDITITNSTLSIQSGRFTIDLNGKTLEFRHISDASYMGIRDSADVTLINTADTQAKIECISNQVQAVDVDSNTSSVPHLTVGTPEGHGDILMKADHGGLYHAKGTITLYGGTYHYLFDQNGNPVGFLAPGYRYRNSSEENGDLIIYNNVNNTAKAGLNLSVEKCNHKDDSQNSAFVNDVCKYCNQKHDWTYAVSSDGVTITATCAAGNESGGSLIIQAPTNSVYDGDSKQVSVNVGEVTTESPFYGYTITYQVKNGNTWEDLTGDAKPTDAGTYKASITLGGKTASVEYTIAKAEPKASDFTFTPPTNLTYDGSAKAATVTSAKTGMGAVTVKYYDSSENLVQSPTNVGTYTVKIDVAEGSNYTEATGLAYSRSDAEWKFEIARAALYTATVYVPSGGSETNHLILPTLPDGVQYDVSSGVPLSDPYKDGVEGQYSLFPSGAIVGSWTDGNVTFRTTSYDAGYSATMTFPLTGEEDYSNYAVIVTVIVGDKPQEATLTVSMNGWTYGETGSDPTYTTAPNYTLKTTTTYEKKTGDTYTDIANKPTDAGEYRVTVQCETNDKIHTGSAEFSISAKPLTDDMFADISSVTYTGSAITPAVTVTEGNTLTANTDFTVSYENNENVGTATVKINGIGNYAGEIRKSFTITKADPTYTAPTLTTTYAPGKTLADVALPEGWSWMDSSQSVGDASDTDKTFKARFTPTDTDNYNVLENIDVQLTVNKAPAPAGSEDEVNVYLKYTATGEQTVNLSGRVPGATGYIAQSIAGDQDHIEYLSSLFYDGIMKYSLVDGTCAAGDEFVFAMQISSTNYELAVFNLTIRLTAKDDQAALTITGGETVVYGQTLTFGTTGGSGSGAVTYRVINGTGEATIDPNTGVLTPVRVGTVKVTASKAADADFNEVTSTEKEITITRATPTGEPKYTKITTSGKTLEDAALTITDSTLNPNAGTLEWVDDAGNVLPNTTAVAKNTTYKWRFTPTDTNYTTLSGAVELYHVSSSSSSGSPTYSITTPDKTENGTVTVSPKNAKQGSTVTITVTPDAGYVLGDLGVTDKGGKDVTLTKKSDTEYTFVMPAGQVEVKASFVKDDVGQSDFADVKDSDYFYDAVRWAVEKGVTNGTDATHFSPDASCTRAQIVTFLWRAAGSPEAKGVSGFVDVAESSYYAKAVAWAVENGITTGTGETTFSPDAACTRAQIVTFLWRAAGSPEAKGVSGFVDVAEGSYYAKAVAWAVEQGITNGTGETTFSPDASCTRAQSVTFLWRAAGSPAVSGSSGFADVPGDSYYAQAVAWAAEKGITTGVAEGKFDPNGTCTRAQIATFLYRTYTIG